MDDQMAGEGIDPLHFSVTLFILLLLFVFYLLLPRGFRVHYFHSYPKRYVWSARSRTSNSTSNRNKSNIIPTVTNSSSSRLISPPALPPSQHASQQHQQQQHHRASRGRTSDSMDGKPTQPDDEIIISATMQQLRDPGILIVAHGSRGKPKTVRLQLTETAITWRTETRKKVPQSNTATPKFLPPKLGKLHQVPLSHIMYVDVGKQTTALRRVENASVSESLCFSLLTKEGSLDLEASSPRERDALVNCFSLVLDEVHAQNWRDIYRGPSSDNMPSSFDDFEAEGAAPHGAS